jgi:hypothetical protein
MPNTKEKKADKPISVKFKQSTLDAIYKASCVEDRPFWQIVERSVRRDLKLEDK